jgi:nucleoside-diphosphate-sugar epimerase
VIVAVTGATGFVGQALLDRAAPAGVTVRALARRPQAPRAGVTWIAGDLADAAALRDLASGAEAVVHLAGVVNAPDPAEFDRANADGTQAMVDAAVAAGVPRFVLVSSLSAREPGLSRYGASKLAGEQRVTAAALDWTVVRPPAIYGPRDREMLDLFRLARRGIVPLPPGGRLSAIHVDDLARLLLALLPRGADVSGRVFEPDDGEDGGWTHVGFARAIGEAVGRRVVPLPMPAALLRLAARGDRALRGAGAKLSADRVGYLCHPDWVVARGAEPPPVRWRPQIPTREGLKATARWYREAGWL